MTSPILQPLIQYGKNLQAIPGRLLNGIEHPIDTVENWLSPAPVAPVQAAPAVTPLPAAWQKANEDSIRQQQGSMIDARRKK